MLNVRKNIVNFFNKLFRRSSIPIIANVAKQNYETYHRTYDTLSEIFSELEGLDVYLVGGISAAIQSNQDLYRQNSDIDIMCNENDLSKVLEILNKFGYSIDDRRTIKTRNIIDSAGHFIGKDHELNANIKSKKMLNIGIFTYRVKDNEVITYSYAFDEKEGKIVGTETIMPRELFDLMYDKKAIEYKGVKLKTQSKEYVYMIKSNGNREKDKLDASVIEPILDEHSKAKIDKIRKLESKKRICRIIYNKDGNVESKVRFPTLEEKINDYLDYLFVKGSTQTPDQIISDVLQSDEYHKLVGSHPEINSLLSLWKEKAKDYTYRDKVNLLTKIYSGKLKSFSTSAIDNALSFLRQRQLNHGNNNDDIELSNEATEIFNLMKEYEEAIKKIFIENDIAITHITNIAPEQLEGDKIRKSLNIANNYCTSRVDGVFASSIPVDGRNPYIARNSSGMVSLGKYTYIYGSDNINVVQDTEGKKHAVLKQPNFIYHINPNSFKPVCTITVDSHTHQPIFEFSDEWISDTEIDISDATKVKGVEEVRDITSLLEHYTILCDTKSQRIGLKARQMSHKAALLYITEKLNDGSIRNINHETGINDRDFSNIDR